MKETRYRYKYDLPYSLHDQIINNVVIYKNTVRLAFYDGYIKNEAPYKRVQGNINIEMVDLDFADVHIMSLYGRMGSYKGKKMSLVDFMNEYSDYSFEVVDELHGYNQVIYEGYLSTEDDKSYEMRISIYHKGDIVYITEEQS